MSLNRSTLLLLVLVALLAPIIANAQSTDRAQLPRQIEALRNEIKQKEALFLAPSDQDKATYAEFLTQRDTGICRLMPRGDYEDKLLIRGGGAYYSFTQLSNSYDSDAQIQLERGQISTGFAGADYGYLTDLGDVPIDTLNAEYPAVMELAALLTPSAEPDGRTQARKSGEGVRAGNHVFKSRTGASVTHTYLLRSISYDRSDTLVALRVVRQDDDGSLILIWKILNRFPTPQLMRADIR